MSKKLYSYYVYFDDKVFLSCLVIWNLHNLFSKFSNLLDPIRIKQIICQRKYVADDRFDVYW